MLYAFPMDRTGCGFYRVIWPLSELKGRLDYTVVMPGEDVPLVANTVRADNLAPSVRSLEIPDDCSAVLLQRPTSTLLLQCIPFLKQADVKVIVEVDDDLSVLTPRHSAFKALHFPEPLYKATSKSPAFVSDSAHNLKHACDLADLVVCSTPAIRDRYAPGRGVVLRNRLRSDWASCLKNGNAGARSAQLPVPPRVSAIAHLNVPELLPEAVAPVQGLVADLEAAMRRPVLSIGWGGVLTTHPDDLAVLNRALPKLRDYFDEFVIAGPVPEDRESGMPDPQRAVRLLGIDKTRVRYTGSVPFADWYTHLARTFSQSVAVAPLESCAFNLAKSWLKPLEYAACGIPVVRSATPEYNLLGVGLPATDSYKAWASQLRTLLASPALRDDLVARGLEIAAANTYRLHADEWFEALAPFVNKR